MDDYPPQPKQEQEYRQPPPQQPPNQSTQYQTSQPPWPPQQYWQQSPLPKPYIPARQPPHPKRRRKRLWVGIVVAFCLLVVIWALAQVVNNLLSSGTDTFIQAPVQSKQDYKASATSTTVAALDKNGNTEKGTIVHFTCSIMNFVKDSSGNTAGANVDDPTSSGVIQIAFPTGTDLSRLNTGDSLAVWGVDNGTFSGPNVFGATVQEVGISAAYMTDYTTGYSI